MQQFYVHCGDIVHGLVQKPIAPPEDCIQVPARLGTEVDICAGKYTLSNLPEFKWKNRGEKMKIQQCVFLSYANIVC